MGGRQVSPLAGGDGGKKTQIGWLRTKSETFFLPIVQKKKKTEVKTYLLLWESEADESLDLFLSHSFVFVFSFQLLLCFQLDRRPVFSFCVF